MVSVDYSFTDVDGIEGKRNSLRWIQSRRKVLFRIEEI